MEIIDILHEVLDKSHVQAEKKIIDKTLDGNILRFACPLCGDSHSNTQSKRGNLYLNNLRYICYNGDCVANRPGISFTTLLKHLNHEIDIEDRIKILDHVQTFKYTTVDTSDIMYNTHLSNMVTIDDIIQYSNVDVDSKIKKIKPITNGSVVYNYLIERKITKFDMLYEACYYHKVTWYEPVIVILNGRGNNIIGMQIRNIKKEKQSRWYEIFNHSKLYDMIKKSKLDDIDAIGYNKLSMVYNILNVDWNSTITFFEGYLDTLFCHNSISGTGLNTDIDFLLNNDIDIRFMYDNDKDGIKKACDVIKKGYSVFLWNKLFEVLANKSDDYYSYLRFLHSNFKDLNDIAKYYKNPFKSLKLHEYFSKDMLDIKYL